MIIASKKSKPMRLLLTLIIVFQVSTAFAYSQDCARSLVRLLKVDETLDGYNISTADKENKAAVAELIFQAFSNYRKLGIPFKTAFLSTTEIAKGLDESTIVLVSPTRDIAASVRVTPVEFAFDSQSEFDFKGDRFKRSNLNFETGPFLHIASLSGNPQYPGLGLRLLAYIQEIAKTKGDRGVSLVTANAPGTEKLYRFYQRMGFKAIGITERSHDDQKFQFEFMIAPR